MAAVKRNLFSTFVTALCVLIAVVYLAKLIFGSDEKSAAEIAKQTAAKQEVSGQRPGDGKLMQGKFNTALQASEAAKIKAEADRLAAEEQNQNAAALQRLDSVRRGVAPAPGVAGGAYPVGAPPMGGASVGGASSGGGGVNGAQYASQNSQEAEMQRLQLEREKAMEITRGAKILAFESSGNFGGGFGGAFGNSGNSGNGFSSGFATIVSTPL